MPDRNASPDPRAPAHFTTLVSGIIPVRKYGCVHIQILNVKYPCAARAAVSKNGTDICLLSTQHKSQPKSRTNLHQPVLGVRYMHRTVADEVRTEESAGAGEGQRGPS
jgi:hypothetical protein